MKYFKKSILIILLSLIFFSQEVFSAPIHNIKEYTLENGLKVYLLEDDSDALTHIKFVCRAGFSSQTQNTCGFFKLYSRLIEKSSSLNFSEAQCNSDSSRYSISISPQQTDSTLEKLSQLFFSPQFSEDLISTELSHLKQEVTDNADSLSTYINAAIDSRVFSDAPWKNDSGIYPPLFKKTTSKTARNILQDISNRWYIPQNSAIFIHGNINTEKILLTLKQTFGRFYTNYQTPIERPCTPINSQRKYVFHNPEISPELTQIVIQYTMMTLEECDLLAAVLNNDASSFKQQLLSIPELNIPGAEYIDVSSAHKRDNSRLIFQTLIQPPENKSLGINSLYQAQEFISQVLHAYDFIDSVELQFAKKQLEVNLNTIESNPGYLMENLSSYWAFEPYLKNHESDTDASSGELSSLVVSMANQFQKSNYINMEETFSRLQAESPFIFVIINTKDYGANQKAYKEAGFEEINENNSSWYVQTMYKEIRDQFKPVDASNTIRGNSSDNAYFQRNYSQIKKHKLSNGINIISKQNQNSTGVSLLLSIKGGKLNSADDNGFEEVMINLLAGMIEKEIEKRQFEGLITGYPRVSSQTDISTSSILIEFEKEDELAVCEAISKSIIYGEIPPAAADKAVSSKQYRKRLENGSAVNQLYAAAIKTLYGKTDFIKIFESEKDVLEKTDYTSILAGYPALLDAGRYNVILTGDFDDDIFSILENTIGIFSNNNQHLNIPENIPEISKSKNISVKVRHTFLTDIPAEKAGPQPAVLIPTTEFLDPVIYIIKAPAAGTKERALFNGVLNYFEGELQKAVNSSSKLKDCKVSVQLPASRLNFGTIILQNVNHTKEADSLYKSTIQKILNRLYEPSAKQILQEIQNNWTLMQLQDSAYNSGTAKLLQKGLELIPEGLNPEYYLEEYNYIQSASVQDFINIMEWFPQKANLRVYSSEGKE